MVVVIWSNSGTEDRWKGTKGGQKHQQSTSRNSIWNYVALTRSFGTLASLVAAYGPGSLNVKLTIIKKIIILQIVDIHVSYVKVGNAQIQINDIWVLLKENIEQNLKEFRFRIQLEFRVKLTSLVLLNKLKEDHCKTLHKIIKDFGTL